MKERYNVIGHDLSGEKETEAQKHIDRKKVIGTARIEGEFIKTPYDLQMIKMANDLVSSEIVNLGIETHCEVLPEQIHFLPNNYKYFKTGNRTRSGFHNAISGMICLKKESASDTAAEKVKVFKTLLHEIIHVYSFEKFYANNFEGGRINYSAIYRSGYKTNNINESDHVHFKGLNEAVTEMLTIQAIEANYEKINASLGLQKSDWNDSKFSYTLERKIISQIIEKLSLSKAVSQVHSQDEVAAKDSVGEIFEKELLARNEFWTKILKGYFTGDMMFLRELEEYFGKGSLRVLSALDGGTKDKPNVPKLHNKINERIYQFFTTDDQTERDHIAHEILNERERLKYLKSKER